LKREYRLSCSLKEIWHKFEYWELLSMLYALDTKPKHRYGETSEHFAQKNGKTYKTTVKPINNGLPNYFKRRK
jgi:hypothetical protein